MQRAAILNNVNYWYGSTLVKQRIAANPDATAAAVFARLAVAVEATPGPVDAEIWQTAALAALRNAGASTAESGLLPEELKSQERGAGSGTNESV